MAVTPRYGWPIPELQHVPDVPKWNGDLARAAEITVQSIGRIGQWVRHSDDVLGPGSWGGFVGGSMTVPPGALLIIGVAHWFGLNCWLRLEVNGGVLMGDMRRANQALGYYMDTLMGVIYTNGGGVSANLMGNATDANMQFGNGSALTICYLGTGA